MGQRISLNRLNKSHNFSYNYLFLSAKNINTIFHIDLLRKHLVYVLIECIYRHLILEVGRKSKYQRNWKIDLESNICSSPLTITSSSSQEIFKAFIVRWSWSRFIFRFPQIGRISLDNRTNIYLSDSKWESTEVP